MISEQLFSGDVRGAFTACRRMLRTASSDVSHERGGFLPGHRAIALGVAMERLGTQEPGRYLGVAVALMYRAASTV